MNKSQKGFSAIEGLLILIILGIIAGTSWYVLDSNKKTDNLLNAADNSKILNASNSKNKNNKTNQNEDWLTYKNEDAGLTFKYPASWSNKETDVQKSDKGEFWGVEGEVTSPDGKKMEWKFMVAGGKGGQCAPKEGDVAFRPGNKCPSKQILSVEKATEVKRAKTSFRDMFEDALIITRTKYMNTSDNKITYQICLDPFYTGKTYKNEAPTAGAPTMALLFPCQYWSTGLNAKYEVKNEADFNSPDAKTAEKIMKTFDAI
jgi:hypothetical protein